MEGHISHPRKWLIVLAMLLLVCGCSTGGGQVTDFRDDFEEQGGGWDTDQREQYDRGYAGGEYFIELYEVNWFAWSNPGVQFDDVTVEVDAYLSSGTPDGHFGVLCRYEDEGNFYYFAISADGYYGIFRREQGADLKVLSGEGEGMNFSSVIRTGGQTNSVQAVCQGDRLSLYANGELLEAVTDSRLAQGDVGVGAGSGAAGDARVHFDNFVATRP